MRWGSMHWDAQVFLFLWEGGGVGIFVVPNVFATSSQYVPKSKVMFCTLCPHNSRPCHIKLGQNWWPTQIKIEIFLNQWGEAICIQEAQFFPSGGKWTRPDGIFSECGVPKCILCGSFMFPSSAQWLFNMFPMCSQCVPQVANRFPVAANFIPYVLPKVFFF